jgi:hypothetical protein
MGLKSKPLALFLIVAAWVTTLCITMAPSHACCKQTTNHLTAALPSCCTGQWVIQPSDQPVSHGLDPGPWVSAQPVHPIDFLNIQSASQVQSWLASAHVPDQSGRYLELRVLLN